MKTFLLSLASFFLIAWGLTGNLPARGENSPPDKQAMSSLESQLLFGRKKIRRMQQGIESQQQLIKETNKEETRILDELATIQAKLRSERKRLSDLQGQLARQQQALVEKKETLADLEEAKNASQQFVKKRLAAYYRMGQTGLLNVIFSSAGLAELLRFDTYYQSMLKSDKATLDVYREKIEETRRAARDIERQKAILSSLVAAVDRQAAQLADIRQQRQELLNRVHAEKQLYQAALEEIQEASKKLTTTILRLEKEALLRRQESMLKKTEISVEEEKPKLALRFQDQKGSLSPPVDGIITKKFGKSSTEKFGLTLQTNGITISCKPGTAIKAVFPGRVVYVGELRGYGNLIIIDHDQQYYSLVARAEQYYKKRGDWVMTGEVIGIAGESAGLLENGLHFEIRHGTTPVNPLEWLNPKALKIAATH
jgi:septal ring factor EnvC (AmiA/AmiB activator)